MKALPVALVALLLLAFTACSGKKPDQADIDNYKNLIVGKWMGTEGDYKGFVAETTDDGKLTMTTDADGTPYKLEGTYQLVGETITVDLTDKVREKHEQHTLKIKRLNQEEMILVDSDDEVQQFKRQ